MQLPAGLRVIASCSVVVAYTVAPARAEEAPRHCAPTNLARQEMPALTGVPAHVITVGTLNLHGKAQIGDALAEWTERRGIDILLLQEVGHAEIDGVPFAAALSERLRFHSVYAPANILEGEHGQGLAILSRYSLEDVHVVSLPYHRLRFRSRCRIALAATVATAGGRIRLVNVHLDTRINSKDRLAQLAPVLGTLDGVDAPQLIGGDFNTMDVRWLQSMWPLLGLERQVKAVGERLAALGFHTPFKDTGRTIRFPLLPFRLDWLYLKDFAPLEWSVDAVPLTDHRGVWARMRF